MAATKTATESVTVTLNRTEFSRKLDFVSVAAEGKTTIPILAMVKITLSPKSLKMVTTNLDVSAEVTMQVESEFESEFCVDVKRLARFVKSLPDTEVKLQVESTTLRVVGARSKVNLPTRPADDFPMVESPEADSIALPATALASVLKSSVWAVSKDESRFTLSAVKLVSSADRLRCVGCDGSSLAIADAKIVDGQPFDCLLPSGSVPMIASLLAQATNEAFMTITEKAIWFQSGVYTVSSRLGTGQFPNYELVENSRFKPVCALTVDELAAAIDRLCIVASASSNKGQYLNFEVDAEGLTITSPASDNGEGVESVAVESPNPIKVCMDGIRVMNGLSPVLAQKVDVAESGQFRFSASWPIGESGAMNYQFILALGRA